jgi:hypothetical protein
VDYSTKIGGVKVWVTDVFDFWGKKEIRLVNGAPLVGAE